MRKTASAPPGTIAPVAMLTHVPSPSSGAATPPANTCPTMRHGAAPRTAQPSTVDVGKAGRSVTALRSVASVAPSHAYNGTATGGRPASRPVWYAISRARDHVTASMCADVDGCTAGWALTRSAYRAHRGLSDRRREAGQRRDRGSAGARQARLELRRSIRAG